MGGDPSRIRTCNPRSRNPLLYPVELWDHNKFNSLGGLFQPGSPSPLMPSAGMFRLSWGSNTRTGADALPDPPNAGERSTAAASRTFRCGRLSIRVHESSLPEAWIRPTETLDENRPCRDFDRVAVRNVGDRKGRKLPQPGAKLRRQ